MNKCRTCKHWGDEDDRKQAPPAEARSCARISAYHGESEKLPTLAYTLDGSGYFSALMTYPEFGCVLWEGK